MWVVPFDFESLVSVSIDELPFTVFGLQGVPISEVERAYLDHHGLDALEQRLLEQRAAHYDFYRPSVV